jgi:TRAP-type C4-dicarboxylate transport system substrate-binding protein
VALAGAAAIVTLAACGGTHADKAGGDVAAPLTLRIEMPDAGDPEGTAFAADVARRSGGSLRVVVDSQRYSGTYPSNEVALARRLAAGDVQLGYLPARAWAADGVAPYRALLAPFAATTMTASDAIASGPIARQLLAALPRSVVGLALVPSELRQLLSTRPLVSPAGYSGTRVRVIDDPQSAADIVALGGVPVQGINADAVGSDFRRGSIDALETSPDTVLRDSYLGFAHYLTSYAVFPKFESIVVSRPTWRTLSDTQRDAIRAAAADAVANARRRVPGRIRHDVAELCAAGIHLAIPSASALQRLSATAGAADRSVQSDAGAASILREITALPESGPQPLPVAESPCTADTRASPGAGPTIPDGTYRVTDTAADWRAGDVINPDFQTRITFTFHIHDGRWSETQQPDYPDQGPTSGVYSVHGDHVTWIMLRAGVDGDGQVVAPETVTWSYFNGQLRFRNVTVADYASRVIYAAHPWRRIR